MIINSISLLVLLCLSSVSEAVKYTFMSKSESVYWACLDALNPYVFENEVGSQYAPNCAPDQYRFLSWVICNFNYQTPDDLEKSLIELNENCEYTEPVYNYTLSEYRDLYEKSLPTAIDPSTDPNFNISANLTSPVLPPKRRVELFTRAYYSRAKAQSHARLYGGSIFIYFAGCMFIGGLVTWSRRLCPKLVQRFVSPKINAFRGMFTLPPVDKRHTEHYSWKRYIIGLVPTRAQTYILFGYFALNIIVSCIDYDIFADNFYTSSKHQVARQTADLVQYRTGVISTIHTPVVFLLSGRNNLLLYLTGWPYETFLVYHKWTARGMWIHALVHSAAYTWMEIDRLSYYWSIRYWYWGGVSTIIGGLMLFQASSIFRIKWYETFKSIHMLFSVFYIIGLWYHLIIFDGEWMEYVYASIALWCADHFFRILRLLWFGIFRKAEFELFEEDETIKIKIERPSTWKPFPGAFVYLYVLRPYGFWQSHPFTILAHDADSDDGKSIFVYAKVKGGITKTLAKSLASAPDRKKVFRTLVEGPYGFEAPLKNYENALIITGGNGVPTGYSNYSSLTKSISADSTRMVKWIWIIKDLSPLKWFKEELTRVQDRIGEIDIYVTRMPELETASSGSDSDNKQAETDSEKKVSVVAESNDEVTSFLKDLNKINIYFSRPNIDALVISEMQNAKGSVGILTCGPPKMNDEIRNTVAHNLNMSKYRVDYFEEAQVW